MQKKTTTKNSAHSRIKKYIQIFVTVEEKVLSLGKFRVIATGGQGGLTLHLGLQKIRFLEHHVRSKKPTMMQNVIITFNPTNLIKVIYITYICGNLNNACILHVYNLPKIISYYLNYFLKILNFSNS